MLRATKNTLHPRESQYNVSSRFLYRISAGQERVGWYIQRAEGKNAAKQEYFTQQNCLSKMKKKNFPKQMLRQFITTRPALHDWLKEHKTHKITKLNGISNIKPYSGYFRTLMVECKAVLLLVWEFQGKKLIIITIAKINC